MLFPESFFIKTKATTCGGTRGGAGDNASMFSICIQPHGLAQHRRLWHQGRVRVIRSMFARLDYTYASARKKQQRRR